MLSDFLNVSGGSVNADHRETATGQFEGMAACSATKIQHALRWSDLQEPDDLIHIFRRFRPSGIVEDERRHDLPEVVVFMPHHVSHVSDSRCDWMSPAL